MRCAPKKSGDQARLRASCMAKSVSAAGRPYAPRALRIIASARPISAYNMVHATPNTQPGGTSAGFCNAAYHELSPADPPMPPDSEPSSTISGTATIAQRSEEHTSELPSLMRISYAVFCLQKKKITKTTTRTEKNE